MKNIIRLPLPTPQGSFLVDAEHASGKILSMRVHPILEGICGEALEIDAMDGKEDLRSAVQEIVDRL